MLRAAAREFAEGEIAPIAYEIDASEKIPDSLRKKLRENNFFSLLIPATTAALKWTPSATSW